ncbi:hypothetical protein ACIBSV_46990 [Embleya sp. NPDC050154]|uniref:hypothetical protein n=1 Tax=Embleya sp. NPDC050154 TaxID=3363988 RepID=UPI0037B9DD87
MTPDDLIRELTKIGDALDWTERALTAQNEANAALHCSERVLYQPLTTAVINARASLAAVAEHLADALESGAAPTGLDSRAQLAEVLTDLDRCEHGRHEDDVCGSCGGTSHGNPHAAAGDVIGYGLGGDLIVRPRRDMKHDPKAWRRRRGEDTPR